MTKREHSAPTADRLFLSPTVFLMLLVLCDGERHGYALKRELVRRTGGKLNPGPGVLYGSMLEQALIEESDQRPQAHLDDGSGQTRRQTGDLAGGHCGSSLECALRLS